MKLLIAILLLTACCSCAPLADELSRPAGYAPWDPPPGRALFEQIPNWDNEAAKKCCGRKYPDCQPWQSPRC